MINPKKITLIITGLGMGGAERQVCDLADQFADKGHHVLLISMNGETVNRPQFTNIQLVEINMTKTPQGFIKAYWQVRRLIEQFKPDVVHSHMVHANLFARLLRLTVSMPKLICTAHSTNEGGLARVLAYRLTDRICNISTNVSQEAVDAFVAQGAVVPGRMLAMHNGIDTERFIFNASDRARLRDELNISEQIPLLLAVGRLNKQKDYPSLLTAFQQLIAAGSHAQLAIIGTGEEQAMLIAMVADLGLSERVHFLGLCRNVHEWMSAADVFVLSSALEGFGLVVAEAMACERNVVATDCGGVKEVVGDCGMLVPPKNSVALAEALAEALALPSEQGLAKGRLARQRIVERYSLTAQAEQWLQLYQQ
ncbi:glycosyltransferase [Aeromonas media]|nr:glycosyltransferase [Aeromonas media]